MSDLPRQIRLAPGDYFMHGQDCRMRQAGLPGNVCCAVIKLGEGFDVERLRRRIAASPIMDWLARAKIFRPVPMLFPPLWRATAEPREILFEHGQRNGVGLAHPLQVSSPRSAAQRHQQRFSSVVGEIEKLQ